MKRFVLTVTAAAFAVISYAQVPGVLERRPANDPEGKILTMEETILSRELSPQMPVYSWFKEGKGYVAIADSIPESPEARYDEYCEKNGLYLHDNATGENIAVAVDDNPDIVYGQIVSRNEFGIYKGTFWSPDSTRLAFYRKDESKVTAFPLLDIRSRTGKLVPLKYPMAGMDSEILRLCIYETASGDTLHVNVTDFGPDRYLTGITWSPDSRHIFIQVLDRSQKHMRLNMYDACNGEYVKTILTEDNDKYVEPLDPLYFIKGSNDRFIYVTSNRDGYRNLYLCDTEGSVRRLSTGDGDVTYLDNDGRYVYYTSAEVSPAENHLFRADIRSGKILRLTEEPGWHNIWLSPDCRQFIDRFSSINNPGQTDICTTDGKKRETLAKAEDPTTGYAYTEILYGTIKSADGKYDNHYRLVLPKDFDPAKKYPVIIDVYGEPGSATVQDVWGGGDLWHQYLANQGYIVVSIENRGARTPRGREWRKCIYGEVGTFASQDQAQGILDLARQYSFIDTSRIGITGWSGGGSQTLNCMFRYPDVFHTGIAIAFVADQRLYDTIYQERYMNTPQNNPDGYRKGSPISYAEGLKGNLLLIHGTGDDNVHYQNCERLVNELVRHGKIFSQISYPMRTHSISEGEGTTMHLRKTMTDYFLKHLPAGGR